MLEGNRKPGPDSTDPAKLAQLLEMELMAKRAAWERSRTSLRNLRALSFFFLFLIIAGALFAFFFFFSPDRVEELRSIHAAASPTPTASASP